MLAVYSVPDSIISVHAARVVMFAKSKTPEKLLPTSDALQLHIKRVSLPSLENVKYSKLCFVKSRKTRLEIKNGSLIPMLMLNDSVPQSCFELIICSCKTGCPNITGVTA